MGRRSLRPIDPSLDLSRHLLTFQQLPQPFSAENLFGRVAPLEVEVGSGKGLFLRTIAPKRPETDFLGIELARKYARFAAAGLAKRQINNATVASADAIRIFHELLPDNCLAAVHVYFPDPWWKKRHEKRRLMHRSFVDDVERFCPAVCCTSGPTWKTTSCASLELLAEQGKLKGPLEVSELDPEHDMDYRTHFERRMRQHDKPVYRAEFRKPAG